jgi:hypothetical protein
MLGSRYLDDRSAQVLLSGRVEKQSFWSGLVWGHASPSNFSTSKALKSRQTTEFYKKILKY